ncbi:MAG: PilZ domain-containing protein [Firmicutes bacterium]|nr:PilZ domain-containing protein [[Eubacterium] siraeum]MCM1486959.1 PilZ domain-containing protein [Bacillota bacterium]
MLLIKGRGLPEIPRNTPLYTIASVKSGERIKYPAFVTVSTDSQLNILVKSEDPRVMEERRRYYKIEADLDCIINFVDRGEERIVFEKPLIAKIKDLNIGGIFLCSCKSELEKGDVMMLTIMLEDNMVNIGAEILRAQKNSAGDTVGYGCRFVNLSPGIEELFAKYVFRLQLEKLKDK